MIIRGVIVIKNKVNLAEKGLTGYKMYCDSDYKEECRCMCNDDDDIEDDAETNFILSKVSELLNREFQSESAVRCFVTDIFTTGKAIGFQESNLHMKEFLSKINGDLLF